MPAKPQYIGMKFRREGKMGESSRTPETGSDGWQLCRRKGWREYRSVKGKFLGEKEDHRQYEPSTKLGKM